MNYNLFIYKKGFRKFAFREEHVKPHLFIKRDERIISNDLENEIIIEGFLG